MIMYPCRNLWRNKQWGTSIWAFYLVRKPGFWKRFPYNSERISQRILKVILGQSWKVLLQNSGRDSPIILTGMGKNFRRILRKIRAEFRDGFIRNIEKNSPRVLRGFPPHFWKGYFLNPNCDSPRMFRGILSKPKKESLRTGILLDSWKGCFQKQKRDSPSILRRIPPESRSWKGFLQNPKRIPVREYPTIQNFGRNSLRILRRILPVYSEEHSQRVPPEPW